MAHFFDMDGTLAGYHRWVYETDGTYPWWDNIRDQHYYRTLPYHAVMFAHLQQQLQETPEQVYILTSVGVTEAACYYEHVLDKMDWIRTHVPTFPMKHFLVVRTRQPMEGKQTKSLLAKEVLMRPLTSGDILYDDFNANLEDWRAAGGTPIKILNGLNTPRPDMECRMAGPLVTL